MILIPLLFAVLLVWWIGTRRQRRLLRRGKRLARYLSLNRSVERRTDR